MPSMSAWPSSEVSSTSNPVLRAVPENEETETETETEHGLARSGIGKPSLLQALEFERETHMQCKGIHRKPRQAALVQ